MISRPNRSWLAALLVALVLPATACGGQEPGPDGDATTSEPTASNPAPTGAGTTRTAPSSPPRGAFDETGAAMEIQLIIGGTELRGNLADTPAGRDFASLLPLELTLTDFHDTEKISDLPRRISTHDEVPSGTAGTAGEITVYAPWGNLALFYRDFTYTDDLVRLGSLEPGAADVLAGVADGTSVTIAATD